MSALVGAAPAPVREPPRLVNARAPRSIGYERITTIPQLKSIWKRIRALDRDLRRAGPGKSGELPAASREGGFRGERDGPEHVG
jgi:hypothetical protein